MRRRDFLFRLGLVGTGLGAAWWFRDHVLWPAPKIAFAAEGSSGWLPYARPRAGLPTATVTLGGRDVVALIDSGAQYSVIDRDLFQALGLTSAFDMPVVAYGVGGQPQVGKGATLALTLGGLELSGLRAAILDLGPLADRPGLGAPLILGQDVLGALVLDIDVPAERLSLHRPADHVLPPEVTPVPVRRSRGGLFTELTVEGSTVEAIVDTGASALLALSREAAGCAGLLDGRPARRGSSVVLGGVIGAEIVQARTLTFGDQLYRRVDAPIYADVRIPGFPQALLGMAAFADRRMVMNLGSGALHVSRPLDLTVG
jgi:predicted aspartyl protease